tara:strand:- start:220 stop:738 length:519 start_codon:yes stop_codon:yes gene_type:complete
MSRFKRLYDDIQFLKRQLNSLSPSGTFATNTFKTGDLITAGDYIGDILIIEGATLGNPINPGQIVYMTSGNVFEPAYATAAANGGLVQIGVAISTSISDGLLIRGIMKIDTSYITGGALTIAAQAYMGTSTSPAGCFTSTAPSTSGHIVRVVGHAVSADIIYFNPSPDYLEI